MLKNKPTLILQSVTSQDYSNNISIIYQFKEDGV